MQEVYEQLIESLLVKGFGSVDGWFNEEEIIGLRKELIARYQNDDFRLAGIGNQHNLQKEESIRNDEILWLNKNSASIYEQHFFQRVSSFVDYLNRTCFTGIQSYEYHYAIYNEGSFYKRHVDQFSNDDRRKYSMVLYLNEDWEESHGGELMLYTADAEIKIQPVAGRVLFFNSELEHEVLEAKRRRLSVTGWMKTL